MEVSREINLKELFSALLRKWWLIVICTVLAGVLAFVYTDQFVTPLYQAKVTFYVNNTRSTTTTAGISSSDLATSQRLVLTYLNILKSDTILEKVADTVEENVTASQIRGMITAEALDETEVFVVKISHANPYTAANIANAIAKVAPANLEQIIDGSSTKIVDYAKVPAAPYSPNKTRNAIIGVAVGAVVAIAFAVLQVLLDVRVKSEEDLRQLSSAPVLGVIPDLTSEQKDGYGYQTAKPSANKEVDA